MAATIITVAYDQAGQRIDNFLFTRLKGLPKSRIYRALRKGEVRVNKGRVKAEYRVQANDQVRIPPINLSSSEKPIIRPSAALIEELQQRVLYEDKNVMVMNKPSGLPVHGGTRVSAGLIEMLRVMYPQQRFMELVHRLDRDTSGCLLIAKKRSALVELHRLLTERCVDKQYLALVKGQWHGGEVKVDVPLLKNSTQSGQRRVIVHQEGKPSLTLFQPLWRYKEATLVIAKPISGRTHQIRVHATHIGHPIAGDEKYGDDEFNKMLRLLGLHRLFLHSASITCKLRMPKLSIALCAPLEAKLQQVLAGLSRLSVKISDRA